MFDNQVVESIQDKYDSLLPYLNEKTRRIWAAIEARSLGRGGVTQVAIATGLSRTTIHAGMRSLSELDGVKTEDDSTRIRVYCVVAWRTAQLRCTITCDSCVSPV